MKKYLVWFLSIIKFFLLKKRFLLISPPFFKKQYWFDRLNNIRITIPSHCRCIVQNELGSKIHDISNFNDLINTYWVRKKK